MREIKFRAWDVKGNKFRGINGTRDLFSIRCDGFVHDDYILQQFTGLTDKNGVEIYEGDILSYTQRSWNDAGMGDKTAFMQVEFKDGKFLVAMDNTKVIGNIYEHPNLLDK